jgi:hypothetical protein
MRRARPNWTSKRSPHGVPGDAPNRSAGGPRTTVWRLPPSWLPAGKDRLLMQVACEPREPKPARRSPRQQQRTAT